jgi:4-aminobutyrate aminotransferase-like enzyme
MIGMEFERGHRHFSAASVHRKLLERGILVGLQPQGNVIRFYPALTIGESNIAYLVENLTQVLVTFQ